MIYVLEGNSGSGKTTYATSLALPVRKLNLLTFDEIKQELNGKDNVVYDRLFGAAWLDRCDKEVLELNEWLKGQRNVKCIGFQGSSHKEKTNVLLREIRGFERLFGLMDVFEIHQRNW